MADQRQFPAHQGKVWLFLSLRDLSVGAFFPRGPKIAAMHPCKNMCIIERTPASLKSLKAEITTMGAAALQH